MERPSIDQQVTFLYTADLEETAVFYETILQLPLVLDQGACRIYRTGGGAFLGFCRHLTGGQAQTSGVILTLVSQDVDGWYGYLRQKGILFEKPPQRNPKFNIYHCFLRDPNGYLIEIQRFEDPTWPKP
ncbi:MAG: VOC family protein [Chloroflexi bacterium]|nr:VOC family protein [Chloroflexota bacterium]